MVLFIAGELNILTFLEDFLMGGLFRNHGHGIGLRSISERGGADHTDVHDCVFIS